MYSYSPGAGRMSSSLVYSCTHSYGNSRRDTMVTLPDTSHHQLTQNAPKGQRINTTNILPKMSTENVSADVIWEICSMYRPRPQQTLTDRDYLPDGRNALLCKRKMSGGVQLSRDPLNLVNKHSRKYEGFVNQTVRLQPT